MKENKHTHARTHARTHTHPPTHLRTHPPTHPPTHPHTHTHTHTHTVAAAAAAVYLILGLFIYNSTCRFQEFVLYYHDACDIPLLDTREVM